MWFKYQKGVAMAMPSFSFIHAADLHLDSPFVGLGNLPESNEEIVNALRKATFKAFDNLIILCIQKEVDFLLIAGDIYDGADRSLQAQLRFRDGLVKLDKEGIATYIVHGNHDPLDGWSHSLTFPQSIHIFGAEEESVVFQKDGVSVARVHGISYPTCRINEDFGKKLGRLGNEKFQIGLLHCNVGGNTNHGAYAPRSIGELESVKLDYWALGHVHETAVLRSSNPFIGYPGNSQGRNIREQGKRGCFYASVDGQGQMHSEPEFLETDAIRWMASDVDINGLSNMDELLAKLEEQLDVFTQEADGRPVVARFTLEGRGEIHHSLVRANAGSDLLEMLQEMGAQRTPFIWIEKIKLQTRSVIDVEARRDAQDFVGELLTMINDLRGSPQLRDEMSCALSELYEHRKAAKLVKLPDRDGLLALLNEVENRCIDMFEEEDY
jgi:exonuclease SbcD